MDDNEIKAEENSIVVRAHLSQPMSRFEVISLVQPLRAALMPLFQASMNSLALLITQSNDQETTDKARKSFDELRDIFKHVDDFDDRLDRLFEGKDTWEGKDQEPTND